MRKIYYYIGLFLLLFGVSSCFEDESKMAQLPLPKINILSDKDTGIQRVAEAGIEYTLDCKIDWGTEDSTQYDYKWIYKNEVISTERFGKYTFNEMGQFPVGFEIIHRTTGLTYGSVFNITVSTRFLLGWLILAEGANEESMLHFIHIDSRELYKDVYKNIYPEKPLGSKPIRLDQIPKKEYDHVVVVQNGGDGVVELDGRTFAKVILLKDQFIGEQYPENFELAKYITAWGNTAYGPEYLISTDGKVYARMDPDQSFFNQASFVTIPLDFNEETFITPMTPCPRYTYGQFFWDKLNRKWKTTFKNTNYDYLLSDFTQTDSYKTDLKNISGTAYNCFEGLPENTDLIYAETIEYGNDAYIVHIIKDATGKLFYQRVYLYMRRKSSTNMQMELRNIQQYEFGTGFDINADTKFWLLRGQNTAFEEDPHLFFNVGNKVYFYRSSNQRYYLYKDFSLSENPPTGKLVTMHTDATVEKIGFGFSDGHFYICDLDPDNVVNPIARGDIDPSNPTIDKQLELVHYTGLGNIVHSIFKYGRWANFTGARDDYR